MAAGDVFTFDGSGLTQNQILAAAAVLACKPCCGGSGSGGSGSNGHFGACCGCDTNWPLGLTCTASIPCIGSRTFSLGYVSGNICSAGSWTGTYTQTATTTNITSPTTCLGGIKLEGYSSIGPKESLTVSLQCVSGIMLVHVVWDYAAINGTKFEHIIGIDLPMTLVSCSPKIIHGAFTTACGDGSGPAGTAYSIYADCVGQTLTVDISE